MKRQDMSGESRSLRDLTPADLLEHAERLIANEKLRERLEELSRKQVEAAQDVSRRVRIMSQLLGLNRRDPR